MTLVFSDVQTGNAASELAAGPRWGGRAGGGAPGQAPEQRFLGNGLQMRCNVGQLRQPSEQERRTEDLPAVESHPGWSEFNI